MMGFHHLGCVFVHVRGADWRLIHVQDGTYHRVTLLQHGDEYRAAVSSYSGRKGGGLRVSAGASPSEAVAGLLPCKGARPLGPGMLPDGYRDFPPLARLNTMELPR